MIHSVNDPPTRTHAKVIYIMTYMQAEEPEKSFATLRMNWDLAGLSRDEVKKSRYPKHSGDVIPLSRILRLQGRKAEAEAHELASRTVLMRRGTYG